MIVFVPLCPHRDSEVLMKSFGLCTDCSLRTLICFLSFHVLLRGLLFLRSSPSSRRWQLEFLWLLIKSVNLFSTASPLASLTAPTLYFFFTSFWTFYSSRCSPLSPLSERRPLPPSGEFLWRCSADGMAAAEVFLLILQASMRPIWWERFIIWAVYNTDRCCWCVYQQNISMSQTAKGAQRSKVTLESTADGEKYSTGRKVQKQFVNCQELI